MLIHLLAVDLEALTELNGRAVDDVFEVGFAGQHRQLSKAISVQIKQVEGNEHDLGGSAFQLILEHREISEAVCKRHDNLAVDDGGASIDLGGVGGFCGSVGPIIGRGG